MRIETLAVHAGASIDDGTRAVIPPIHLSTTFERHEDGTYPEGFNYTRSGNPTRQALETALAQLEGGAASAAFASGSAATAAVFQTLEPGAHVIAPDDAYYGTPAMLREQFARWGVQTTFVDTTDPGAVKRALTPSTRVIWIETPSNPRLHVTDIVAMVALAKTIGARTVVDNTWATPVLQRPLELGVDFVMHSTTKYLGGHSDVLGGVLVARSMDAVFERIRSIQTTLGAVPSPFDCWLILRGLRSLPYRMRAHVDGAEQVAAFLASHRAIARVYYPGLATDTGHSVARQQMRRPGGMLSFDVHGGRAEAFALVNRLKLITRATSLGGPETLIEHRASVEGTHTRAPESLLRVPDDLIEDFSQALGKRTR